ncbi:MAG: acyl-CoA synthetase [Paracoccaceae bacterium]|jgi:fatty-acyl-CoA synthase
MGQFSNYQDIKAIQRQDSHWQNVKSPTTIYQLLMLACAKNGDGPALSFQLYGKADSASQTLTWSELDQEVVRTANVLNDLGLGPQDCVAYILPNCLEAVITLLAGSVRCIVCPINPLLSPKHIAAILREAGAKVVVTMGSFPNSQVAQNVAKALVSCETVKTVLEVDFAPYVTGPKAYLVPLMRPKFRPCLSVTYLDFAEEKSRVSGDMLNFPDPGHDRVGAYFHTGGTTGRPKLVQHKVSSILYQGWVGVTLLFKSSDVVICPLPFFHVFAAYPVMMSMIAAAAHLVLPTPAGYRGFGVLAHFWKLIERWQATYFVAVPTALAALVQRPIDADVSTLRGVFSGSAPLAQDLYLRFESLTGVQIIEGYGLTESTCMVSVNPPDGSKKIGSVGVPLPYSDVRILRFDVHGIVTHRCAFGEVGEICVANPGVFAGETYRKNDLNRDLYADGLYLRTGDLGRLDEDHFLFITGRVKDLIIRGGHNVDPLMIEDTLMSHPLVNYAAAVGQPDARAGEVPCVYVELVERAKLSVAELIEFSERHIPDVAARPKYIEILSSLPKTAVGKVFKPDLRRLAIVRILDETLRGASIAARVSEVVENEERGLLALIIHGRGSNAAKLANDVPAIREALNDFVVNWEVVGTKKH